MFDEQWFVQQMKNMAIERIRLNDYQYWDRSLLLQYHGVFAQITSLLESVTENPFSGNIDQLKISCIDNLLKKKLYPHKFNNFNISIQTEFNWQRDRDRKSVV